MIVPFSAGGGADFVGRLVARYMSDKLGQNIIIKRRGNRQRHRLIWESRAPPDGYDRLHV